MVQRQKFNHLQFPVQPAHLEGPHRLEELLTQVSARTTKEFLHIHSANGPEQGLTSGDIAGIAVSVAVVLGLLFCWYVDS